MALRLCTSATRLRLYPTLGRVARINSSSFKVRRYASTTPSHPTTRSHPSPAQKKHLVVLGTGWGGYAFLKSLSYNTLVRFDVKVISPTTSFSFTPLLAQASCATLDFRSAIEPIHSNRSMEVHHAWCDAIDLSSGKIELTAASNPQFRPPNPLTPAVGQASGESASKPKEQDPVEKRERATYTMPYDHLVICVGSYNATFGTRGVKENALFLKDVNDARAIRWRILDCFELANARLNLFTSSCSGCPNPSPTASEASEMRDLLSFIVVGGGATGSEFAAELHDLIKEDLSRLYPRLRPYPSIKLLDAASTILSSFDSSLSEFAMSKFARDGIEVVLNAKISRVERDAVYLHGGERVAAGMVVWSTGITTSPLIEALQGVGKEERSGKILTSPTLNILAHRQAVEKGAVGGSVLNHKPNCKPESEAEKEELVPLPNVFALGDCSSILDTPLPATAQVASQKGSYLANLFNNHMTTSQPQPLASANGFGGLSNGSSPALAHANPFKFLDKGSMASIGSKQALLDTPVKKQSGRLAWVLWRSAYTLMSMSWRNSFLVPANWASNLLFGRDVGRF
ncbi:related to NDE1 - mitochondrial cytosolically directed NADH dehydrogenase [Ustilago sp. UG-2017a]|nr:related to NDE1 - mitochondrial cytosolically directed NADH dehydrogenase [Ustilago sp. UG-2017a]